MPWEVYWIVEAKTKDTPARKKQEANAAAYDRLKKAKAEYAAKLKHEAKG